jgi:hypothetical protein
MFGYIATHACDSLTQVTYVYVFEGALFAPIYML